MGQPIHDRSITNEREFLSMKIYVYKWVILKDQFC